MWAWLLILVAACGRVGFADRADAGTDDDASDAPADAIGCRDDDGVCPPGCLGMDNDCVAVCGDGICSGNAGESCLACAADCMTTMDVCGNGTCDPGETTASCMPDCGPLPWPFGQLETDFLAEVNTTRAAGTMCPGASMGAVAAAFVLDPADPAPARHNAWEIAHDNNSLASRNTCSGADMAVIFGNPAGYSIMVWGWNYPDGKFAADALLGDGSTCPLLMDGSRTTIMIGAAQDLATGWAVYMR